MKRNHEREERFVYLVHWNHALHHDLYNAISCFLSFINPTFYSLNIMFTFLQCPPPPKKNPTKTKFVLTGSGQKTTLNILKDNLVDAPLFITP
jgi:hypothetical protein